MDQKRYKELRSQNIVIGIVIWIISLFVVQGWGATFVIFCLGWVPFIAGPYIAKSMAATERKALEDEKRLENERLSNERRRTLANNHEQATLDNDRATLINTITSVKSYIALLSDPEQKDNESLLKQNITSALAGIISKYKPPHLAKIISSNEEIQTKLHNLNASLQQHKIDTEDIEIMLAATKNG